MAEAIFTFNDNTKNKLFSIINDYDGGEIFFGCILNQEGIITDVESVCHGNDNTVLAPYDLVKKYNAIIHNHPSGNVKPSEQDLYYAEYLQNEGIGFFIIDNEVLKLNIVVPPIVTKKKKKLELEFVNDLFSNEGYVSKNIIEYEYRAGQQIMSVKISESFNENKISVIEAGTGIGKSLAYLIPAFLWSEKNKERVIISTNTINLQNQLLNKDIPLIKKILNSTENVTLVKGRRNYLCKLKIYNMQSELELDEDSGELNSILKWSGITSEGDVDELNFIPKSSIWEKASSDADFCSGRNCLFYQSCFFQSSRRKASESNILVVNHHLLFADLDIRRQQNGLDENVLLPPYRKIIFDEAHNIINSASSFFSISISKNAFFKFLGFLKKKNDKGFIPRFLRKVQSLNIESLKEIENYLRDEIFNSFTHFLNSSHEIFENINQYIEKKIFENSSNSNHKNFQIRIKKNEWENESFNREIIDNLKKISKNLEDMETRFDAILIKFDQLKKEVKNILDIEIKLMKSYMNKLKAWQNTISNFINIDIEEYIIWVETNTDVTTFKINATPLNIDKILCNNLHQVFDTIIFCSATLSVNKTFDYFKNTCGLSLTNDKTIDYQLIESPFDYKKNVLFTIPSDIPEPNNLEYNETLNEFIKKIIEIMKGSTFVLFTSYNQLKKSYDSVSDYLNDLGYRCFYQGEMEKYKLLEKFINDTSSNLFATNSFWEGVDAPGKTLRCVILSKLPFNMPTDPIEEARIEDLEKKGINSFLNYSLPNAVIKFRQGFGRLIRKNDDYGVIVLLDSRVLKKTYGRVFINSIPECKYLSNNINEILNNIKNHVDLFEE